MRRRISLLVAVLFAAAVTTAGPASADYCPGRGGSIDFLGGYAGYCDSDFAPDGSYQHCEFGGFIFGGSNCWRVYP